MIFITESSANTHHERQWDIRQLMQQRDTFEFPTHEQIDELLKELDDESKMINVKHVIAIELFKMVKHNVEFLENNSFGFTEIDIWKHLLRFIIEVVNVNVINGVGVDVNYRLKRHETAIRVHFLSPTIAGLTLMLIYMFNTNFKDNGFFTEGWEYPPLIVIASLLIRSSNSACYLEYPDRVEPCRNIDELLEIENTFEDEVEETINDKYGTGHNHVIPINGIIDEFTNEFCDLCCDEKTHGECSMCKYCLCQKCISEVSSRSGECPCCRSTLSINQVINKSVNDIISGSA